MVLEYIIAFCRKIAKDEKLNKMSTKNLASVLAPNIMYYTNQDSLPLEHVAYANHLIDTMIQTPELFDELSDFDIGNNSENNQKEKDFTGANESIPSITKKPLVLEPERTKTSLSSKKLLPEPIDKLFIPLEHSKSDGDEKSPRPMRPDAPKPKLGAWSNTDITYSKSNDYAIPASKSEPSHWLQGQNHKDITSSSATKAAPLSSQRSLTKSPERILGGTVRVANDKNVTTAQRALSPTRERVSSKEKIQIAKETKLRMSPQREKALQRTLSPPKERKEANLNSFLRALSPQRGKGDRDKPFPSKDKLPPPPSSPGDKLEKQSSLPATEKSAQKISF